MSWTQIQRKWKSKPTRFCLPHLHSVCPLGFLTPDARVSSLRIYSLEKLTWSCGFTDIYESLPLPKLTPLPTSRPKSTGNGFTFPTGICNLTCPKANYWSSFPRQFHPQLHPGLLITSHTWLLFFPHTSPNPTSSKLIPETTNYHWVRYYHPSLSPHHLSLHPPFLVLFQSLVSCFNIRTCAGLCSTISSALNTLPLIPLLLPHLLLVCVQISCAISPILIMYFNYATVFPHTNSCPYSFPWCLRQ